MPRCHNRRNFRQIPPWTLSQLQRCSTKKLLHYWQRRHMAADRLDGARLISNADPLFLFLLFGDLSLVWTNKLSSQLITYQPPTLLDHGVKTPCMVPHLAGQEERGNRNKLHRTPPLTWALQPRHAQDLQGFQFRSWQEAYYSVRRLEGVLVIVLLHVHLGSRSDPDRPAHKTRITWIL